MFFFPLQGKLEDNKVSVEETRTTWAAATNRRRSNTKLLAAVTVTEGHILSQFLKLFIPKKRLILLKALYLLPSASHVVAMYKAAALYYIYFSFVIF